MIKTQDGFSHKSIIYIIFLLIFNSLNHADVKSRSGNILFHSNAQSDLSAEMNLNSHGLSIGNTTASEKLSVAGNAHIQGNLEWGGLLKPMIQVINTEKTTLTSSYNFIDSTSAGTNMIINLPSASSSANGIFNIKMLNSSYPAKIRAMNNEFIDLATELNLYSTTSLPSVSLMAVAGNWSVLASTVSGNTLSSTNLVGHWDFDQENYSSNLIPDRSGKGNHAYMVTGTTDYSSYIERGVSGNGFRVAWNGSDYDHLKASHSTNLSNSGNMSFSFWYAPDNLSGNRYVFDKYGASSYGYGIYIKSGNVSSVRGDGTGNHGYKVTSSGHAFTANIWNHGAVVHDGSSIRFYQNGLLIETMTNANDFLESGTNSLTIGMRYNSSNAAVGILDELRVYNRAIDSTEVYDLYRSVRH